MRAPSIAMLLALAGAAPCGATATEAVGTITSVEGRAMRRPRGSERSWVPVRKGDRVAPGHVLRTGLRGRIDLELDDRPRGPAGLASRVQLEAWTEVEVEAAEFRRLRPESSEISLGLVRGAVRVSNAKRGDRGRLRVRAGEVLCEIRGGEQMVRFAGGRGRITQSCVRGHCFTRVAPGPPETILATGWKRLLTRPVLRAWKDTRVDEAGAPSSGSGGWLTGPPPPSTPPAGPGPLEPRAASVFKHVEYLPGGEGKSWSPVEKGASFSPGDVVRTGPRGRLRLEFPQEEGGVFPASVNLGSRTELELREFRREGNAGEYLLGAVDLIRGTVRVTGQDARRPAFLATRFGRRNAGIQGGELQVRFTGARGRAWLSCLSGRCYHKEGEVAESSLEELPAGKQRALPPEPEP